MHIIQMHVIEMHIIQMYVIEMHIIQMHVIEMPIIQIHRLQYIDYNSYKTMQGTKCIEYIA